MLRRLGAYFVEMFPPWVMLPAGALHFGAIELGTQALGGMSPLVVSTRTLVGSLGVVAFQLALRTQDELKDIETDLALAAKGDPKYVDRAIVKGRVLPQDLKLLRWLAYLVVLATSALLGTCALEAAGAVLALVWLSHHWFFLPSMKKNLLLAFATHNPLAAAISCWCVAACVPELPGVSKWTALLVLALWTPVAAWEIGRKIRVPEDETDYTTYSKILGARRAAALVAALSAASAIAFAAIAQRAGAHPGFFALLAVTALAPVGGALAFVFEPSRRKAKLQPLTELFMVVAGLGFVVALGVAHGVRT